MRRKPSPANVDVNVGNAIGGNTRQPNEPMNERKVAYVLTRIAYAVIFLFYGISTFRGP
jgi:hypothetical protein